MRAACDKQRAGVVGMGWNAACVRVGVVLRMRVCVRAYVRTFLRVYVRTCVRRWCWGG